MPTTEDVIRVLKQLATVGPTNEESLQAVQRIAIKLDRQAQGMSLPTESWRPTIQAEASHHARPGPEVK